MNMHTFDEADFRTLFGFSHETYNEYSGICTRLRESVNANTQKVTARKQSKKSTNFKNSFIGPIPRKKLSCREGLLFQNKSFREDVIENQRLNRLKELHKENKLLTNRSRGAVAVQRKISSLSNRRLSISMSIKSESEEEIIEEHQSVFGEDILLPTNSMFLDLDEMTEINKIDESHYRIFLKKNKRVYDSLSDEEASDEEINEVYYVEPFSNLRFGYDLLLFVLVFYSMFSVPYQLAFYFMQPGIRGFGFFFNLLIDIVFIFDIILSFFTAYYDFEEKLVKYYYLMALHYIQTWFIVDFISGIPLNTILDLIIINHPFSKYAISNRMFYQGNTTVMYSLLKLLRLIKAMKVFSMNSFLDKITSSVKQTVFIAKTIRLFTTLLIFAMLMHLFACLVIFFGYNSYPNWISSLSLEPNDKKNIYIASLYFICTTVLSIGYGDILTYNLTERLINGLLLVVGLLLYTWTLSSLTSYLISDDKIIVEYRNKCNILEDIKVCYDNIPNELYSKLQRHLLYKLNSQKMDVNEIFNSLPIGLRNNLIIEMYKPIVENFVFFKNFNNTDFIIQVVLSFKPLLSLKGEKLLNDGDVLDEMIFVKKGKLILEFPLPLVLNEQMPSSFQGGYVNPAAASQTLGGATLYESCGNKHTYAFQTITSVKGNLPWLKKADTKYYELSDFDIKKQFQHKREMFDKETLSQKKTQQYVKLIEIRKNEHFGDVLMFLTKRSPLRVRVKTKTAELYLLKKTDAVEISTMFPKIWKQIIKKSLFNMKQINRLINKSLKFFFIHYEGTKNILAKTVMPFNPNQTLGGSVPHETMISNKNKLAMLAKMTLGKPLNKTQISSIKDIKQVEAEIDTSNSELESIPDNDVSDSSKMSSEGEKEGNEKTNAKLKITRILETFEEDTLKQSIRKLQKQTIIFQHYDELLRTKDAKSSDDDITPVMGNRRVRFGGANVFNKTNSNQNKTKKSSSSSSVSSIAINDNNNNNNNNEETDSSFSSSFDNKSNNTNSNIMNKSKSTINRSNINKSAITDSYKGTLLTYKDMKIKQPPTNILDDLVEKNTSNLSIKHNNSSRLLDDSDNNEGNVYSEFHSNEGDLKDNLFMQRPMLESYDPFSYYYNNTFNMHSLEGENDGSYEQLIQGFNKLSFYRNNSNYPQQVNNDLNHNNTNSFNASLSQISTIQTQKPKSIFKATLSSNSVSKTDTGIKTSKISPDITNLNGPNKPKCNFTFSKYNNNSHSNKNLLSQNTKDKHLLEGINSSSSSSSSGDTQKKSLQKLLKPSMSITSSKKESPVPYRNPAQIKKKQTFTKGMNYSSIMGLKAIAIKNGIFDDNGNVINDNKGKESVVPMRNNRKEMTKVRSKKSRSNVNLISFKGIEDVPSGIKNAPSLMPNNSDSSSGKEKGEEDLEVEKIMNMTPHLSPDRKRGNLFRQILTPATFSRKLEPNINGNEGYKKSFFGLSPTLKKRSLAKAGTAKGNALERITTNIQENSTNLNEPKEFYSNLFSQFLGEQKDEPMKDKSNGRKGSFNEPIKIKEESEELEQTIIKVNPKEVGITQTIKNNNGGIMQGLKRNKTLLI